MADKPLPIDIALGCGECGAHTVIVPPEPDGDDMVACDSCGAQLASVADFCRRIADLALEEAHRMRESRLATVKTEEPGL